MKRRSTPSKEEILSILRTTIGALSHEMIKKKLSTKVDRATIYRVLHQFCEDGIIHKIVGDDGKQYFALCQSCSQEQHQHNHFHFRCLSCGQVECLQSEINVSLPKGYSAQEYNGSIAGTCGKCA